MATQATKLSLSPRESGSSRATRRLRRDGRVPGVIYGGGADPVAFEVDERELRHALAARGAVLELALDGDTTTPVLKDAHYHPARGTTPPTTRPPGRPSPSTSSACASASRSTRRSSSTSSAPRTRRGRRRAACSSR